MAPPRPFVALLPRPSDDRPFACCPFPAQFYPRTEKYISLFRSPGDEALEKERQRIRGLVEASGRFRRQASDLLPSQTEPARLSDQSLGCDRAGSEQTPPARYVQANAAEYAALAEANEGGADFDRDSSDGGSGEVRRRPEGLLLPLPSHFLACALSVCSTYCQCSGLERGVRWPRFR